MLKPESVSWNGEEIMYNRAAAEIPEGTKYNADDKHFLIIDIFYDFSYKS